MWPGEIYLSGKYVTLEPLDPKHECDLCDAIEDSELYNLWYNCVPTATGLNSEILRRLSLRDLGLMIPFAEIDKSSGKAAGMTSFMNIDAPNKRVEIGST